MTGPMRSRLLIVCALIALPCSAAIFPWTNIGPPGGEARSLVTDPASDTTFVLNPASGVYRSQGGGPWSLVFDALGQGVTPTRVTLDPSADRLYVGTTNGLFRSDDQGATWRSILDGAIVDVSASRNEVFATTSSDFFRSGNAGGTWRAIPPPPAAPQGPVTLVRLDPRRDGRLVAVMSGNLFLSEDDAESWTLLPPKNVVAVFFGDFLYVGGSGVYECASACTQIATDTVIDVTEWHGGIYEATSDGVFHVQARPIRLVQGFPDGSVFSIAPSATALLAATSAGIFRSEDGASWTNGSAGFDNFRVTAIARSGQSVFVTTREQSVMRRQDGLWSSAYQGLPGQPPNAPAARRLASDGGTLYAAFPNNGLFRSLNDALTWEDLSAGLPDRFALDVAADGGVVFAASAGGLSRSSDRGATWQRIAAYPAVSATSVASSGSTIAAASGNTALVSTDSGKSWQSSDLPALIRDVAVAGALVYANTDGGLFVRNQAGWNGPLLNAAPIAAMSAAGERLYASTSTGLESSEDGSTWLHVPGSESLPRNVTALLADDLFLYVGTNGSSVFAAPVAPRRRVVKR